MAIDYWHRYEEGAIYHAYNRSIPNRKLFNESKDYHYFLRKFQRYYGPYIDLFAFCLIPNHFHFLFRVKSFEEIKSSLAKEKSKASKRLLDNRTDFDQFFSDQARRFFSAYALHINHKENTRGDLFSNKMKHIKVNFETKLQYLICYIHHNPIHHQTAKDYQSWQYSSFLKYLAQPQKEDSYNEIIEWFGGIENFKEAHRTFKVSQAEIENID